MVKTEKALVGGLFLLGVGIAPSYAAVNEAVPYFVEADSCDERLSEDDTETAQNRAIDKASLVAVKTAGFIQEMYPDLSPNALDIISYRVIDEYMMNTTHQVTLNDQTRVCVKVNATVLIAPEELEKLAQEYQNSNPVEQQVAEIADQVKENTTFKPQNLQQKKLIYIEKMSFWNGTEADNYRDLLTGLFSNSEYFYITDDKTVADYVITPQLTNAEVNEIDTANHKMQMQVDMKIEAVHDYEFNPMKSVQTHFILFAADKDEQEIADSLIRKLLTKSANEIHRKIDKHLSNMLEIKALSGK